MELRPLTSTVKTPAENFTGDVYLNPVFSDGDAPLTVGLVRFTPGARTNWHSHANGQLLVCTDGVGLVASRDGTTIRLRAGESVWTPPGQEHWPRPFIAILPERVSEQRKVPLSWENKGV